MYSDSYLTIANQWTLDELLDAHIVLDAYQRARKRAEKAR